MDKVSAKDLNELRSHFGSFRDRFQIYGEELIKLLLDSAPPKFRNITSVPEILKADSEGFTFIAVAGHLKLAQATLDVSDDLVDMGNVYAEIWVGAKRQTLEPFIAICWDSLYDAGYDVDPKKETGIDRLKVDEIAAKDAKKDDKGKVKDYIEALAKFAKS